MRIGIFDSGLGGLTVLKSLIEKYPNHQYYYFGDTINIPYGEKTKEQLLQFSDNIINFLMSKKVDLIIIACGTISSNLYDELKNKYNIKIIDVIGPIITYLNNSDYQRIGIIATTMTIKSKIFEKKVNKYIISVPCPMFVPLIENNLLDTLEFEEFLDEYLSNFKEKMIDALVLGCTHYPLIKKQIKEYLGNIPLVDMGEIIANQLTLQNEDTFKMELYFSKVDNKLIKNVHNIIGEYEIYEKKL
ncbi:MAG: glutamate racemase [Mollicutes bacterium]|nr:glutamate racemase [Mollicutes bacterium]